jgi:hypothetical protein
MERNDNNGFAQSFRDLLQASAVRWPGKVSYEDSFRVRE